MLESNPSAVAGNDVVRAGSFPKFCPDVFFNIVRESDKLSGALREVLGSWGKSALRPG